MKQTLLSRVLVDSCILELAVVFQPLQWIYFHTYKCDLTAMYDYLPCVYALSLKRYYHSQVYITQHCGWR